MHLSSNLFNKNEKVLEINISDMPRGVTPPPWSFLYPSDDPCVEKGIFLYYDRELIDPLPFINKIDVNYQVDILRFSLDKVIHDSKNRTRKWILYPVLKDIKDFPWLRSYKMIINDK